MDVAIAQVNVHDLQVLGKKSCSDDDRAKVLTQNGLIRMRVSYSPRGRTSSLCPAQAGRPVKGSSNERLPNRDEIKRTRSADENGARTQRNSRAATSL